MPQGFRTLRSSNNNNDDDSTGDKVVSNCLVVPSEKEAPSLFELALRVSSKMLDNNIPRSLQTLKKCEQLYDNCRISALLKTAFVNVVQGFFPNNSSSSQSKEIGRDDLEDLKNILFSDNLDSIRSHVFGMYFSKWSAQELCSLWHSFTQGQHLLASEIKGEQAETLQFFVRAAVKHTYFEIKSQKDIKDNPFISAILINLKGSLIEKFKESLDKYPQIKSLKIRLLDGITKRNMESILHISALRHLDLSEAYPTDQAFQILGQKGTKIESLNLSFYDLKDEFVKSLEFFIGLKILDLSHTIFSNEGKKLLAFPPNLTSLNLDRATNLTPGSALGGEHYLKLRSLNLRRTQITDFSFLGKLSNLEVLNLYQAPLSSLDPLVGCPNLQSVNLREVTLSCEDIAILAGLRKLRRLNLHNTSISNNHLDILSGLTELEHLDIGKNEMVSSISSLAKLSYLEFLILNYTNVGKEALPILAQFHSLKRVNLIESNVKDISDLQRVRPKLGIIF